MEKVIKPEFAQDFDYMNDGKPIAVKVYGTLRNDYRQNLIHISSLGVCPKHEDYFRACSAWLAQIGICNLWCMCNQFDSMRVETELGDVIAEFSR